MANNGNAIPSPEKNTGPEDRAPQSAGMHVETSHEPLVSSDGPVIEAAQRPGRVRTKRGAEIAWPPAGPLPDPPKKRQWIILAVLLLLAALPRFVALDRTSLWGDEILCILNAERPANETIEILAAQNQPPGYHLLLSGWLSLFNNEGTGGDAGWAARLLSAFAGVAAILATFLAVRLLLGFRIALLTAILGSTSIFWIIFAREATMYALFLALSMGTVFLYHHLIRRSLYERVLKFWIGWVSLGLLRAALLYIHYFTGFLIIAEFFVAIYISQKRRRPKLFFVWIAAHLVCLAAFAPWLPILAKQVSRVSSGFWTQPFSLGRAINLFRQYLLYLPEVDHLPWIFVFLLVAAVTLFAGVKLPQFWLPFAGRSLLLQASRVLDWWFRKRTGFTAGATDIPQPRPFPSYEGVNILLIYLGVGLSGALLASLLLTNLFEPKYLIPFSAFAYALVAAGLVLLPPPLPLQDRTEQRRWIAWAGVVLFGAAQLAGLFLYFANPGYRHPDLRGARAYIDSEIQPLDVVVTLHPEGLAGMYYYSENREQEVRPLYLYTPSGIPPFFYGLGSMPRSFFIQRADLAAAGQKRVWLVAWSHHEKTWEDHTETEAARMGLLNYWAQVCGGEPLPEPARFRRLEVYRLDVTAEFDMAAMMKAWGQYRQKTGVVIPNLPIGGVQPE